MFFLMHLRWKFRRWNIVTSISHYIKNTSLQSAMELPTPIPKSSIEKSVIYISAVQRLLKTYQTQQKKNSKDWIRISFLQTVFMLQVLHKEQSTQKTGRNMFKLKKELFKYALNVWSIFELQRKKGNLWSKGISC